MNNVSFFAYYITNAIGLLAFAISGVYKGVNVGLDLLGIAVTGFVTALGGGITRDILANRPPAALAGYNDIGITFIGITVGIFFYKLTLRDLSENLVIKISDAVGLAAFTVTGAVVAYHSHFNAAGIILLSFSTAVGGGLISDILTNRVPMVLKEGFYASCSIIGAIWFYITINIGFGMNIAIYTTFLIVLITRVLAIYFKWHLPKI